MEFQQIITQGCSTWNIVLPEQAPERLEQYNTLLLEKNKVMNLTAITQPEEMAENSKERKRLMWAAAAVSLAFRYKLPAQKPNSCCWTAEKNGLIF